MPRRQAWYFQKKTPVRLGAGICQAALALALLTFGGTLTAAPPAAERLPASTSWYVSLPDVRELDTRLQRTQLGQLYHGPEMAELRGAPPAGPNPQASSAASLPYWGISWEELTKLAGGEVCCAGSNGGSAGGFLLLADTGGQPQAAREFLDRLSAAHQRLRLRKTTLQVQGETVTAYRLPGESQESRFYFLRDGVLGISDQESLIDQSLAVWKKPAASLAKTRAFQAVMARSVSPAPVHLRWFLNPWEPKAAPQKQAKGKPDTAAQQSKLLGLEKAIGGIGGVAAFDYEGRDALYRAAVFAPEKLEKGARMLHTVPVEDGLAPSWVSPSAAEVSVLGSDFTQALAGYGSWFDVLYAEGELGVFDDVLLDLRDDPEGPRVDIRKDIVAQLTGPVWRVVLPARRNGKDSQETVYAARVRDERTVAGALRRLLENDPDVAPTKIGNHAAWRFRDLQSSENKPQAKDAAPKWGPDLSHFTFCVAGGYLFVATHESVLSEVVQSSSPQPGGFPFARALKEIRSLSERPAQIVGWHHSLLSHTLHGVYEGLQSKEGPAPNRNWLDRLLFGWRSGPPHSDASNAPLLLDRLPPFDKIRNYLGTAGSIVERVDDGWLLIGFLQAPPKTGK